MSNSFLDSLEIGLDGNVAAQDGASTASADPIGAIERVALQKGINPDHLIGLAKLETRLGDATIKGDGQDTYNLFNIKDFSKDGTGIRARDKAEGSNDRYRKYGSYEESAQDLIGLLERRYPAALNASTPEEFAKALKAGGYATDPSYVQKLTRTIGSNSTPGAGAKNGGQKAEGASFLDALSTDDILNLSLNGSDGLVESAFKPIKDRTGGQMAGDLALGLTQGGIGAIKSLTDLAGTDNSASAWLDDASKGLQSAKSEYAQQTAANSQKRIEDAKGQGTMAEIGAYMDAIWDAPLDMTAQAAGSLLPFLFTGVAGAGAKALGMANAAKKAGVTKEVFLKSPAGQMAAKEIAKTVGSITSKANIGMGIGMGLGGVKGQQYETTLKEAKAKGLSDEEAKKLATEAQAYGGSMGGTLQQLGGAALGGIGAATGPLERALSRIPSATQPGRGIIGRTLVGGLKEAAPEGAQGAQQAWAGNEAAVGAGVMDSSRRFEGVAGQGVQEAVLAFPMGGVAGALEAGPATQPAPQKPPSTPIATPPAAPTQPQTPPPAAPAAPAAPTGAAPVVPPTAQSAPADPQLAAMSDADLNALIEAIDAADDDAVTDEQWSQYASAISEVNRRAAAAPPAAPTAPAEDAAALAPLPTYMPGPEVNTNRAKEQPKVVLQNRDRSGAASVLQMTNIAANPDFLRIGPSTEMTTGAPVVFGDLPATAITGRPETVVDGKGDRIQAQYAVVDAGDLIPSNNADGTSVQAYANGLPGKMRAVAGNGRTAGIQKAYQQGTADQYRQDLIENAQAMGLDADAIRGMQKPVLVRVMDAADVRDDMGDRTNISGTQRLSPVEQAANDARRLNLADLTFDDNGNPTQESLRQFINAMEDSEKGDLMGGKSGAPTKQAIDRLMAATFKQAYDSDELVDLYAQAPEPEARAILNAAGEAAGALAALKEMNPDFDVREAVADAVKLAVNASRQGMPLAEFAQNADLDIHPDAFPVARFLSRYANKPRQMANGLREWANDVLGQAEIDRTNQSQGGLFGAQPTLTREELFARLGNIDPNDQFSIQAREALAKREAEKSAAQELPQPVAIEDIPDDLQPEDVVEAPSDFDLEAQTPEQLQAQADERAAEEKRQRNAEQAAEAKAQADAEVDSFTLTGSDRPADANPNQGDLLAADQPQQGDVLNNVGQPFASPKAAEIKAKKDGKGGQVVPVQGGYVVRMPQNMSGTPSATMGTRTDAKAGPGFTAADVVRRDPIAGQKINDEWTAFAPQSGTLGIPRAQMPQVKASDRGAMVNFLKARGIDSSKEQLPPTALKPTQAEFSPAKVQEAADRTDGDRSIIVSADGYVVDGHHQWLAQRQKGEPINVIRLDQPITQVLDALKEMPSAQPEQKQGVTLTNDGDMPAIDPSTLAAKQRWEQRQAEEKQQAERDRLESEKYNAYVREQEFQAERRRLQGDRTIRQANGKPFKTAASAQAMLDKFDLGESHVVQQDGSGFALRDRNDVRESYMQARDAVLAEMGITGEAADGDIDATEAQWDEIHRRVDQRLKQKLPAAPVLSSYTPADIEAQPERAQDVALTNEGEMANAADTPADQFGVMALPEQIKEYLLKPSVTMRQDGKTISAKDYIDGLLADGYGNPEYFSAPKGSQAGFLSKPGKPKVTLNDKQMLYADAAFMAKKGKSGSKPNQPPATAQQAQAATESVASTAPPRSAVAEKLRNLFRAALSRKDGNKDFADIGVVSSDVSARIKEKTGLNLDGYTHSVDESSVRHIMKQHGDQEKESARGQVAITEDDVALIPEIVAAPDDITKGEASGDNKESVIFKKKIGDAYVYVQEVRGGRKKLVAKTLWKVRVAPPAATEAGEAHTSATLDRNTSTGSASVPPTDAAAQPITRADVQAAEQQAAAIMGARIDAMSVGSKFNARQAQEAGFKAREEAKKAQRQAKRTQAAPEDTGLRVGVAPGSADPVTVRDGVVLIGDYEAVNYDTGEPVIVPKGSTRADVAQALKNAGALSSRQKMFGLGDKAQDVMFSRTSDTDTQAQRQFKETERAYSGRAAKQGAAPADASLEEIFTGLDSSGLPKAQATKAAKAHPQADLIEQVNSQFHDLLLDLMETQGVLEVNGQTTETEDNKSCL